MRIYGWRYDYQDKEGDNLIFFNSCLDNGEHYIIPDVPAMVNRCLLRLMLHLLQSTILLNDELFGRRQVILD